MVALILSHTFVKISCSILNYSNSITDSVLNSFNFRSKFIPKFPFHDVDEAGQNDMSSSAWSSSSDTRLLDDKVYSQMEGIDTLQFQ